MKLFAALWAAALSATLGGSFLGAPVSNQNIHASLQETANAVNQAGSFAPALNMLAPISNDPGPLSLSQAVSTFQHRAGIIDDMYDASGTAWLPPKMAPLQGSNAEAQRLPLGLESPMSNMASPWQNLAQQQQLPGFQPSPMVEQLTQIPQAQQQLPQMQQMQQSSQMQQMMDVPQMQQMDVLQSQPLPAQMDMPQSAAAIPATSFITQPLGGDMQPAPLVNAEQLFRDSSLPAQSTLTEPAASQFQLQADLAGKSLLSLLGEGQGQGFGPTDPPRESPWGAMYDPMREPPAQLQQPNPYIISSGQVGQPSMMSIAQQQPGMMSLGQQQPSMMSFGQQQPMMSLEQQQPSMMSFGELRMSPDTMGGNPNTMAFQQQAVPGNTGCILCSSQAAQEDPQKKWANYFSQGEDNKRKHDEAFE